MKTCIMCEGKTALPENDLVCGTTAVPGCVVGIVRIVRNAEDIAKMETGDILVTVMTDPDSVPAMHKAVAVVTDRGGMLCHAAIVCREFRKPCIVGSRNATDRLENGMRVVVCATRGIVRRQEAA